MHVHTYATYSYTYVSYAHVWSMFWMCASATMHVYITHTHTTRMCMCMCAKTYRRTPAAAALRTTLGTLPWEPAPWRTPILCCAPQWDTFSAKTQPRRNEHRGIPRYWCTLLARYHTFRVLPAWQPTIHTQPSHIRVSFTSRWWGSRIFALRYLWFVHSVERTARCTNQPKKHTATHSSERTF